MKLVVDSGSTKTDWCFIGQSGQQVILDTDGINPAVQNSQAISSVLSDQLIPMIQSKQLNSSEIDGIFFYGAGCTPQKKGIIANLLRTFFCNTYNIQVESDMLGAARAVCGRKAGIACILGTGSNSCFYDGNGIVAHTPALGYILGDEGSGAVLGKNFINALLKGKLSHNISKDFFAETNLTENEIIDKVYKSPKPNRFLASMSNYIFRKRDDIEVHNIIINNFLNFIRNNIFPYGNEIKTINAVGSIAHYYKQELSEAANRLDYKLGVVLKNPILNMAEYHKHDL